MIKFLEKTSYEGKVFLNSFREDEFKVHQTELKLGHYYSVYKEVLVNHTKPTKELIPVMYQAINIYLDLLKEDNAVVKYINKNKDLATKELIKRLFDLFPTVGYGDTQYKELIIKLEEYREQHQKKKTVKCLNTQGLSFVKGSPFLSNVRGNIPVSDLLKVMSTLFKKD